MSSSWPSPQVAKAEGSRFAYTEWAAHRAPGNLTLAQLQQLVAAKLAAATAEGVAEAAANATRPDGSLSSARDAPPLTLLQRWLLAEVGLAAQQLLQEQAGNMTRLAAFSGDVVSSGPDAGTAAQPLSADSPPNSKNQDPGIVVDLAAVANPDITLAANVATAASRSSQAPASGDAPSTPLAAVDAERANQAAGVKVQSLVPALWGLDRIDARPLPLDGRFQYGSSSQPGTGRGVTIFILDSGILASHQEFARWGGAGGSSRATLGPDFVDGDGSADDCDGHGTHVASTGTVQGGETCCCA